MTNREAHPNPDPLEADAVTTTEEDLVTIIDFCNEMATSIRGDWSDPRSECRTIWDAHDIAHVLTGGGRKITDWVHARAFSNGDDEDERFSEAWPDVRRRMAEVVTKAEGITK